MVGNFGSHPYQLKDSCNEVHLRESQIVLQGDLYLQKTLISLNAIIIIIRHEE